jgi:hypothetical protein
MDVFIMSKDFNWVNKVLLSSENDNHIVASVKLFNNFLNKWRFTMGNDLKIQLSDDFYENYWLIMKKIQKNDDVV